MVCSSFQFPDLSILLAAVDVITMFTSVAPQLRKLIPDMPRNIIQVISYSYFVSYSYIYIYFYLATLFCHFKFSQL